MRAGLARSPSGISPPGKSGPYSPSPSMEPRARHILSWNICLGSLQGNVTPEARKSVDCQFESLFIFPRKRSTALPSCHEGWQLLPPAQPRPHRLFLQTNPPCSHCFPIPSCVLPDSAALMYTICNIQILKSESSFQVNTLGNKSWQYARGNGEFLANTGKNICIKLIPHETLQEARIQSS